MSDIAERLERAAEADKFDNARQLKLTAKAEIERLRAINKPITMSDIRLCAGEGKLEAHTVLQAANVILARRALEQK